MKAIRWGMIGCGAVAEVKSGPGFYKSEHSALVAVTSRQLKHAQSFAKRHGVLKVYASREELVADPDIDAVYIATPPSSHKSLSLLAAKAGKHVYVEKPMARRFEECRDIVEACRQQGVRLFVAFYRRAMPRFLQVKAWIDEEVHGIASNQAGVYWVEDTVTATWRHASGVQGVGSWCYVGAANEDAIQIIGYAVAVMVGRPLMLAVLASAGPIPSPICLPGALAIGVLATIRSAATGRPNGKQGLAQRVAAGAGGATTSKASCHVIQARY